LLKAVLVGIGSDQELMEKDRTVCCGAFDAH